ncbi:MAG: type VI secretion system lipoprotein TssJ [Myxococcales bacterium]|nr:type VI secretion system lipoprotein TssJ [Myxococcales bacterium]
MRGSLACLCGALLLVACNKPTVCTVPEPANLWVQGSARLNPDPDGEPLPTLVRVYQVSNLGELEQATFEEMMRQPEDVLGETLLATEEITVYPGRSSFRGFERDPGANYVVGVAVVRQPSGNQWRTVLSMPGCMTKGGARPMVRLMVDGYTIEGAINRDEDPQGCDQDDSACLSARADAP